MIFTTKSTFLSLSDKTGSVESYIICGKEFIADTKERLPLFTLKLLDKDGEPLYFNAFDAKNICFDKQDNGCCIEYKNIGGLELYASAFISVWDNESIHWTLELENNTDYILEWSEYPEIAVIDSLKGEGGDFSLFWPNLEGVVIEDKSFRNSTGGWLDYKEIGGQSGGYCGYYPGSCPMQFMAYYTDKIGLYFGAHDKSSSPKTVEYREEKDCIALEYRLFLSGAKGKVKYGYDMVTSPIGGDWTDAAEYYRSFAEKSGAFPKKLYERTDLPQWLDSSPVVMIYPVRGTVDHGDMTPNLYYPYTNILPIADKYAKSTDSKIMALPMHWEGTAPWAPPYVWPPFGGEDNFKEFVDGMHAQGNLAGVYCSGIGWTVKSALEPSLDLSDRYDEKLICRTPKGTIENTRIIGRMIRDSYDMCPHSEKVAEIVSGEVVAIAKSGCDYAQYFDQNLGGMSSICYGKDHGHPPAPGKWQNDDMIAIFDKVIEDVKKTGSNLVLGCECAAAEPFISKLVFNDLRYNTAIFYGKAVPAYAYVFHEYIGNFMGNQNCLQNALKIFECPENLLFRIGYSFTAGDMLTLTLADQGKIHWGWDVPWDYELPEQEPVLRLIRNINHWRIDKKEFLRYGKMLKPLELDNTDVYTLHLGNGKTMEYPSLLCSRWRDKDENEAQLVVNFLDKEQTFRAKWAKTVITDDGSFAVDGEIKVKPLSAVWLVQ